MPNSSGSSSRSISQFFHSLKHKARQRRLQQRRQRPRRVERHAPALELLEDRLMLAAFSEAGSQLDVDLNVANSHVRVQSSASNEYVFTLLSGDTWQGTDTANVFGHGTALLTVTSAGRSQFNIVSVTDSSAGARVTFSNSGTNAFDDSFVVNLDDGGAGTIMLSGTRFTGTAALSASTSRNIIVNGDVSTVDGALTLRANQQSTASQGDFSGITVISTLEATGSGSVTIEGNAGDQPTTARTSGVKVDGGRVSGGASGTLTVTGNGAGGTAGQLFGVMVTGSGVITSSGADVAVTGKGGTSTEQSNAGIFVDGGSKITAGAGGNVVVTGTGGLGANSFNAGVVAVGGTITSAGGNVTVAGMGGGSGGAADAIGVWSLNNGTISAGGSGTVTVNGTGGSGTGANNMGVRVQGGTITSSGGSVAIVGVGGGTGGAGTAFGVLAEASGTITAGGSGTISVNGKGGAGTGPDSHGVVAANNGKITSSSGTLTVQGAAGNKAGTGIVLVSTISHTGSNSRIEIATDSINFFGSGAITAGDNTVVMKPLTAGYGINLGPVATGDVTKPGDALSKYPANAIVAGAQFDAAKAIDNQTDTKYALRNGAGKGLEVTLAGGPAVVSDLKLTTAADLKDRDPGSYKLEGKTQGGAYKLIKEGTLSLPDARKATTTIPLGNSVPYATYRLTFPAMRSGSSETTLQIGEVELLRKVTSLELPDGELDKVTAGTLVFGDNTARPITLTENITRASKTNVRISTTEKFTPGS
ncbi:MAG: hypothetical protein GY903_22875, partial [Fuerstiella sp.]|nr:hypothetical protein [Fuerstiella sp.]